MAVDASAMASSRCGVSGEFIALAADASAVKNSLK